MGGLIAFELAQLLSKAGEQVAFLGLFDTYGPGTVQVTGRGWLPGPVQRLRERWTRVREVDASSRVALLAEACARRFDRGYDALRAAWHRSRGSVLPHGVRYREIERVHLLADAMYVPREYTGPVTLFRAREPRERVSAWPALGWDGVVRGDLRVIDLPGSHDNLIEQPQLAVALRAALEAAQHERSTAPPALYRMAG